MKQKGQSTVEYILLVTAVVTVVIFLTNSDKSVFRVKLNNAIVTTTNGMDIMANRLTNSMLQ